MSGSRAVPSLVVEPHVRAALDDERPMVALETSVLAQGLPFPTNLETAADISGAIRDRGAVPAWTWVGEGAAHVGARPEQLAALAEPGRAAKVARRDLPAAVAGGGLGATTVSATLWIAGAAGIPVMATGGIGGVHPGSGDVSADLLEMGRTPGIVVCSGPKSIVDPVATIERLEELGVGVVGYRTSRLPFFLAREADVDLEHRADSPDEAAAIVRSALALGVRSAVLLCNPVPADRAMDPAAVAAAVAACEERAHAERVTGKAVTPFLLSCLAERTEGASLRANVALLVANAALAADVAAALGG